ncbi:MAG: hypothetical protein IJL26_00295 [Clostridia bacterium]|nr:hypothetical protein [Clostridia bacterium]
MTERKRNKFIFTRTDALALTAFVLLAVSLLVGAFYADLIPDEAYYYTIPQRLAQGDRLFVEIWQMSQLVGVLLILPYRLFVAATGSTEGIILFMRLLFAAIDLAFFVYFYLKLRDRGLWGVLAALFFCADQPLGMLTLNYYNMGLIFPAAAGMLLFLDKKEKTAAPKLVLAGVLLSFAVLNDPGLALAYALLTLLVFLREVGKKKGKDLFSSYAFVVDRRVWLWLTGGVVLTAAAFLVWFQATSGIQNVLANMAGLRSDSEYQYSLLGNDLIRRKVENAAKVFGVVNLILSPLTALAALVCRKKRAGKTVRAAVLAISLASFVACHAVALARLGGSYASDPAAYVFFIAYNTTGSIPLFFCALSLCLLSETQDRRMNAFLILSAVATLGVDYFSNIVLVFGGRLAYFPALHYLGETVRELRTQEDKKKRDPAVGGLRAAAAALACLSAVCVAAFIFMQRDHTFVSHRSDRMLYGMKHPGEETAAESSGLLAGTRALARGPLKGLRQTPGFAAEYDAYLADLDAIAERTDAPFYAAANIPYLYLYTDLPAGSYSSLFVDTDHPDRILLYWQTFPEKRPEIVYVPKYDFFSDGMNCMRLLREKTGGTVTEGEAGYFLRLPDRD